MSEHTPGRLYLLQKYKTVAHAEQGTRGRRVFDADSMGDQTENEANARRLVACWNALLDVPTDLLERAVSAGITDVSMGNLFSSRMELQAQRDELLAALERIADPRNKHFAGDAKVVACAAIAKVKGGAA